PSVCFLSCIANAIRSDVTNRGLNLTRSGNIATAEVTDRMTSTQTLRAKLRDYYILTKPEVNLLILMTTSAGYYLGSHGSFHLGRFISTLVGTILVASGTATLHQ